MNENILEVLIKIKKLFEEAQHVLEPLCDWEGNLTISGIFCKFPNGYLKTTEFTCGMGAYNAKFTISINFSEDVPIIKSIKNGLSNDEILTYLNAIFDYFYDMAIKSGMKLNRDFEVAELNKMFNKPLVFFVHQIFNDPVESRIPIILEQGLQWRDNDTMSLCKTPNEFFDYAFRSGLGKPRANMLIGVPSEMVRGSEIIKEFLPIKKIDPTEHMNTDEIREDFMILQEWITIPPEYVCGCLLYTQGWIPNPKWTYKTGKTV